jgi:hypothetical protein
MTERGDRRGRRRRLSADALRMRRAIERRLFGRETVPPSTLTQDGDDAPPLEEIDLVRRRREKE